jgi:hypothetical protein
MNGYANPELKPSKKVNPGEPLLVTCLNNRHR